MSAQEANVNVQNEMQGITDDMLPFEKLMQEVAELPEAEQKNVSMFISGYTAARKFERTA